MNAHAHQQPDLQTAIVTVAYVNPPKQRGKSGSIKDVNGVYFAAYPDKLALFEPNGTYEIAYTQNGQFRNIVGFPKPAGQEPAPQQQQRRPQRAIDAQSILLNEGGGQFRETRELQKPAPQVQPQQRPSAPKDGGAYYRPTAPKDSERMWTCAVLGHYIDRGEVPLDKECVKAAINLLREAYQETYGLDDTAN